MKKNNRSYGVLAGVLVLGLLFLAGCTSRQELVLELSASGTAKLDIQLSPVFLRYVADLQEVTGLSGKAFFDLPGIRAAFARQPSLNLKQLVSEKPEHLFLSFGFTDGRIAGKGGRADLVRYEITEGRGTFTLLVRQQDLASFLALVPAEWQQAVQMLAPGMTQAMTRAEYFEYLRWALADYDSQESVTRLLTNSVLTLELKMPGKILSASRGNAQGSACTLTIPLLELLTLEKPLEIRLAFSVAGGADSPSVPSGTP